jgi:hypothetical protein
MLKPEPNLHICGQFVFSKDAMSIRTVSIIVLERKNLISMCRRIKSSGVFHHTKKSTQNGLKTKTKDQKTVTLFITKPREDVFGHWCGQRFFCI